MFLQRIRVPDFRVLKNVDISFEKEFIPTIFPLGSLNGGGKSTLLQLIFVLLHCSTHPDRVVFLQNLLEGFRIDKDSDKRVLAIIDIWDGNQNIELEFFTCNESFIKELLKKDGNDNEIIEEFFLTLRHIYLAPKKKELAEYESNKNKARGHIAAGLEVEFGDDTKKPKLNKDFAKRFTECLSKNQIIDICDIHFCDIHFDSNHIEYEKEILLCHVSNLDINEASDFLIQLSDKVFLAAPISQIFLFLSSNSRESLFKTQYENSYDLELKQSKTKLPSFLTYDSLSIDALIASLNQALKQDIIQKVKTSEYGTSYQALLKDLNSILMNKTINLNEDLSGVNFTRNDNGVNLSPQDLSHGELKRLCIYMWIKSNKIESAIVLMDEIEIDFNPDWQYQIVRDLEEWSSTNQYILATHSYDLCEAVTPAHVKLLSPKLIYSSKNL